jgi:hypothetical protein
MKTKGLGRMFSGWIGSVGVSALTLVAAGLLAHFVAKLVAFGWRLLP